MTQKIRQDHPRFNDIKAEASHRFDQDFNNLDMKRVEDAFKAERTSIMEQIKRPSFRVLADEWLGDLGSKEEREVYAEFLDSEEGSEPDADELVEKAIEEGLYEIVGPIDEDPADKRRYLVDLSADPSAPRPEYADEDAAKEALGKLLLEQWQQKRNALLDRMEAENLDFLDKVSADECSLGTDEFYEWLEENKEDEVNEHYDESEHYPMWSTLFEAKDSLLNSKIEQNVDELYEIGIGVIDGGENLNNILFIGGAGYDFFEAHWIPMYILFGWIDPTKYPDPKAELTGCAHCGRTEFTYPVQMKFEIAPAGSLFPEAVRVEQGAVERPQLKVLRCTYCGTEHSESNFAHLKEATAEGKLKE